MSLGVAVILEAVYIAFMWRPPTYLKICVFLGDTGEGIVAPYFMLTGSIFQFVIKYPIIILRAC